MNKEFSNVINLPALRVEQPMVIGSLALKVQQWEAPEPVTAEIIDFESYRNNPLRGQIEYLDKNYAKEGLKQNWDEIDNVGFSISRQMRLLEEVGDVNVWAEQTAQDLLGFGLEYLRQGTVFPFEYQIQGSELVDQKYGGRRMLDTVDSEERGGAVLESLDRIQAHLLNGNEGTIAIMVSPPGYTGLKMDDGSSIVYTDTMVFHLQKVGDKVIGTTIRTDLNLPQARELIKKLSGQELPQNSTPADCTKALTLLDGIDQDSTKTVEDLVDVVQSIKGSRFSYKDRTWNSTRLDIQRRNELYFFDQITHVKIDQFVNYAINPNRSKRDRQKGLAAAFIGISQHLLVDKEDQDQSQDEREGAFISGQTIDLYPARSRTIGALINQVRALPGCMGGGRATLVRTVTPRSGLVEQDWNNKATRIYDNAGPCNTCGKDVPCGPCHMCQSCNEMADINEQAA